MTEREMEDLLWNHPEKLLNETLNQFSRQQRSRMGRSDLVFVDRLNRLLVVEVKKGTLPRGAIDQLHDYFGVLKREFPDRPVELMVVAHRIPDERRLACDKYDIEAREVSEKKFRDVAQEVGYKFDPEADANERSPLTQSMPARLPIQTRNPRRVEKAWYFWRDQEGKGHFLAFVNAQGNCSIRFFDADDGGFLGKRYGQGDYQEAFREYIAVGVELVVGNQPNLEKHCRVQLPSPILSELRRQIPKS